MADNDQVIATHGPYEDLAIAAIELIGKIVDKQPPEVAAELWRGYLADMKAWREFWASLKIDFHIGKQ